MQVPMSSIRFWYQKYLSARVIFSINIMLPLNESERPETIESHFQLKVYDTINSPGRKQL